MSARLDFLQALRGVAALVVVLWHGSRYLAPYGTGASAWFGRGAVMGVSLFFLISGFIMTHTTRNNPDFRTFVVKRVTRIWPVWLIALALYMPLHSDWTTNALLGSITLLPVTTIGDGPPVWDAPILGVGWTLKYEVYFYAFFAVSLLFGRLRWWAFGSWAVLTLVFLPGLGSVDRWSPSADLGFTSAPLQLITNQIILLFVIGAGIGMLYGRFKWPRVTVLIALALVGLQWVSGYRIGHGAFECGLTLIPLMLAVCLSTPKVPSWLVWLGNVSFSLYLFHPLMQERFDRLFTLGGVPAMLITTGLSLLAAWASYELLERGLCTRMQDILLKHSLSLRTPPKLPRDAQP